MFEFALFLEVKYYYQTKFLYNQFSIIGSYNTKHSMTLLAYLIYNDKTIFVVFFFFQL